MTLTLHDASTEKALVRCALNETALFGNTIKPGDIWTPEYRAVWQAGRDLHAAGRGIDRNSLAERLAAAGISQPATLLADLFEVYESPVYAETYAGTVTKWAGIRQLLDLLTVGKAEVERTIQLRDGNAPDVDAMLARLSERFEKLRTPEPEPARRSVKTTWTVAELLAATFPEPRWAVPGMIPVGLSWLAGRPKVGKSWLALQIAHAVGSGGMVFDQHVDGGKVLYLALEDSPRRLKSRLEKQQAPADAAIDFFTSWRSLTDGGIDDIRSAIAANGYRLAVVDTFSRAAGRADQGDWADMSNLTGELQTIALDADMAVLVLDHHRKPAGFEGNPIDDIANSTAKSATLDAALGLYKQQGKAGATLKVIGREVEEADFALSFDTVTGCWQLEGTVAEVALRGNKTKVLDVLRDAQPNALTMTEFEKLTGITANNLHPILAELVDLGLIDRLAKQGREVPYRLRTI